MALPDGGNEGLGTCHLVYFCVGHTVEALNIQHEFCNHGNRNTDVAKLFILLSILVDTRHIEINGANKRTKMDV